MIIGDFIAAEFGNGIVTGANVELKDYPIVICLLGNSNWMSISRRSFAWQLSE